MYMVNEKTSVRCNDGAHFPWLAENIAHHFETAQIIELLIRGTFQWASFETCLLQL